MNLDDIKELWQTAINAAKSELPFEDVSYQSLTVDIHNASWCPDCEREVSLLLALDAQASKGFGELVLHSYEDKESYKARKQSGSLSITCLPTIIFYRDEKEIFRVEEDSAGQLIHLLSQAY
mgnify:CR=1 FL=1